MNLKVEYGIIAILLLAFLYYFFTHQSLLSDLSSDLSSVPDKGNPELKAVKGKHAYRRIVVIGKNGLPLDRRTCISNCMEVVDNTNYCENVFDGCPKI